MHHLQVGGQIGHGTEHEDAHSQTHGRGEYEITVGKKRHGNQRILSTQFHQHKYGGKHNGGDAKANDLGAGPVVFVAAPGHCENEAGGGNDHGEDAQPVHRQFLLARRDTQNQGSNNNRDNADRNVEPQAPTPAGAVGKPTT